MLDDDIRNILNDLPDYLEAAPNGIDMATQQAYIQLASTLEAGSYPEEVIDQQNQVLLSPSASIEEKKKALILMADTGRVTAARLIEQFLQAGDTQLRDWAAIALLECQVLADNVWAEDGIGIIMTGLGGEGHRLRYFFILRPISQGAIAGTDRALIAQAFAGVCESLDSILEDAQIYPTHVCMKALIPMDVAVAAVIEGGIEACNQSRHFLDENYFVTNVEIPAEAQIQAFVEGKL